MRSRSTGTSRQRRGFLKEQRPDDIGTGSALERRLAREHLVEQHAEREHVRTRVDLLAARLLRRHVPDRAHHDACLGLELVGRQRRRRARVSAWPVSFARPKSSTFT